MSVTDRLTPRDRQLAGWFKAHGFAHPFLTVAALRVARIKPQTAAAQLTIESGGGRNVFGCDYGDAHPGAPPYCGDAVTAGRLLALLRSSYSNGVGPTQLTFKGYLDQTADPGDPRVLSGVSRAWAARPFLNMVKGFSILRGNAKREGSLSQGARAYNGSGPAAEAYAAKFMRLRGEYRNSLRRAGFKV